MQPLKCIVKQVWPERGSVSRSHAYLTKPLHLPEEASNPYFLLSAYFAYSAVDYLLSLRSGFWILTPDFCKFFFWQKRSHRSPVFIGFLPKFAPRTKPNEARTNPVKTHYGAVKTHYDPDQSQSKPVSTLNCEPGTLNYASSVSPAIAAALRDHPLAVGTSCRCRRRRSRHFWRAKSGRRVPPPRCCPERFYSVDRSNARREAIA
jgi:hypothetical protein